MTNCSGCLTAKATLNCGVCEAQVCKACAVFLEDESFSFLSKIPDVLQKETYCNSCFQTHVQDELTSYEDTMNKAREIFVYMKDQGKETRLMKRSLPQLKIKDCVDKDEAILRLAFLAVKQNCNAIIDVDIKSEKVRMQAYQTLKWHATATPVQLEGRRFNR